MITECIREYLDYLDPGNRRYLEELRRGTGEGGVPIIWWGSERFPRAPLTGLKSPRVPELGTVVGYSVLITVEGLLPSAHVTAVGSYASCTTRARENLARYGVRRIILVGDDISQVLRERPDKSYDFLFLDAAKEQHVKWFPELLQVLSPGGMLLPDNALQGDDTAESRFVVDRRDRTIHSRIRVYLERLSRTEDIRTSILPIGDGLTFNVKM